MNISYMKERIEMKATIKLLTVAGFAGLSLAACGTAGSSSASPTVGTSPLGVSTYGFNHARTEFVLPHHLGLLPASELALAKADPTYANGLANPNDWVQLSTQVGTKTVKMGFYVGSHGGVTGYTVLTAKSFLVSANNEPLGFGKKPVHSTSVPIEDTSLNHFSPGETISITSPLPQLVGPTTLEVQAAPVGTLSVSNGNLPAFCVPLPEAYIANGKVVNGVDGLPVITAGPSSIFAGDNLYSSSPTTAPPFLYDKGTTSCAAFH